jgi:general secretion pathway protein K
MIIGRETIGRDDTNRSPGLDNHPIKRKGEEGVALIAVLWIVALLSLIAVMLNLETRSDTRVIHNAIDNAAARAAADAGIQRAILDLAASPSPPTDTSRFRADGTVHNWRFGRSTVQISIQSEATKTDLNSAPESALAALFVSVGVDSMKAQSLAEGIIDFRLSRPRDSLGLKQTPFQAVEELQQVARMTTAIYNRVVPLITIYNAGAGTLFGPAQDAYLIRAAAEGPSASNFVREAVVLMAGGNPVRMLVGSALLGTHSSCRQYKI